jgi:hypothetical protein
MANPVDIIETAEGVPITAPQAAAVANLAAGNIGTITSGSISGSVVAPATAVSPGSAPHWPPTTGNAGDIIVDIPASGVVGTFTAGAASIAPGTDHASRYPIAAARTLSQASALTLATTGSPVVGNKIIACYALSLGYVLSIVNGGPLANTLATFGATLPNPLGVVVYWDGTNYKFNGYVCMS